MAFETWQIGLDIQNGQICALGIHRRRDGWQLRHWWQHTLPHDTLVNGLLQRPEPLIALLQQWRKQLPRRISLRVGFPFQLVLQCQLDLPPAQLREPERSSYIMAAARQFFPVEPEGLVLDYREQKGKNARLWLTAARREAVHSWLECLTRAGLKPQALELTPAALYALAQTLKMSPEAALVHRLPDHWLWFSTRHQPAWGWCSLLEADDLTVLRAKYFPDVALCYYSAAADTTLPQQTQWLDPLAAFAFKQPPLPTFTSAFTLAAGLALRPEDT